MQNPGRLLIMIFILLVSLKAPQLYSAPAEADQEIIDNLDILLDYELIDKLDLIENYDILSATVPVVTENKRGDHDENN